MNYRLLTGCFAGSIVEDGCILDVAFNNLDLGLQKTILDWAETQIGRKYIRISDEKTGSLADELFVPERFTYRKAFIQNPLTWEQIKEDYENDWDSEETDDDADLKPLSEWRKMDKYV